MSVQTSDRLPQSIGGYRIVRRLAREATIDVLLATSDGLPGQERTVVLKLVSPPFRGDASFDQTFARETQAISQLDHPCIVRLFDVFSAPDIKAMVLEHVEGPTLSELRAALVARGESLPDVAVYGIGSALFSALATAHAARDPQTGNLLPIVHRDVHPGQIVLARDGSVKLAGFGLERITGVRGDARAPEARGYLPPEKARGEGVTIRSDVYAAMLVIWELLARRRAVRDDALPEQELARALAQPTLVSLEVLRPEVPALVRSIVARGLEPLVERRAVTAEEAASIFRSAASPEAARQAIAHAVAKGGDTGAKSPEPPRAREPSLPSFPMGTPPDGSPAAAREPSIDKRGPPRPSPRRMWGSSPTLTPAESAIVSPPSSRLGSIPDARFSQDADRVSTAPAQAQGMAPPSARPPISRPTPPPSSASAGGAAPAHAAPTPEQAPASQQTFGKRTQAGGFDLGALRPLLGTPQPTPAPVAPAPAPPLATQDTAPAFGATPGPPPMREPSASLPGMGVPLLVPTPGPPMVTPAPPPAAPAGTPFWSVPPAPPGAAPLGAMGPAFPEAPHASAVSTYRPPPMPPPKRSIATLALGLFFVAVAVGAGGFVAVFRKGPKPVASASSSTPPRAPSAAPLAAPNVTTQRPTGVSSVAASAATSAAAASTTAPPPAKSAPVASVQPPAATTPEAPSASPSPAATPSPAPSPGLDANMGALRVDKRAAGHRIFFDGKVIGEGEGPFPVPCGKHTVKVGSRGKPQKLDVPCGAEISVSK